ncbi:MAG: hypothetical protein EON92_14835 [Burkholderiales bacterium]|nr:MAG: hypothetical protein EON92_14835 [Burkholderiales bacterium]
MTPAKKRKARPNREMLSRYGLVTSWDISCHARAQGGKALETRSRDESNYLKIHGTLTEAVNGVVAFDSQITGSQDPMVGRSEIACVGAIIAMRPAVFAGVDLSLEQFNTLLAVACSGRLKSFHLSFQTPHYGKSLIASISFYTSEPEG